MDERGVSAAGGAVRASSRMWLVQVVRATVVYFVVRALFAWKAWMHDPGWFGWHFFEAVVFGVTMTVIQGRRLERKGRENGVGQ